MPIVVARDHLYYCTETSSSREASKVREIQPNGAKFPEPQACDPDRPPAVDFEGPARRWVLFSSARSSAPRRLGSEPQRQRGGHKNDHPPPPPTRFLPRRPPKSLWTKVTNNKHKRPSIAQARTMAAPTSRGAPGHAAGRPRTPRSGSGPSSGPSSSGDSRGRRYAPAHEGADYDRQGYCLKHVSSFLLKTVSSPQDLLFSPLSSPFLSSP